MAVKVISKMNQKTKFLARISHLIDRKALEILAGALVQGNFDYACMSWFTNLPQILKNKLQTSQNKLVRLILKLQPLTHLTPAHFSRLKWLTEEDRVNYIQLCMVHGIIENEVPKYLRNYFPRIPNTHSYSTRTSATDLVLFRFRSCMGPFLYSATVLWNGLPTNMKTVLESL